MKQLFGRAGSLALLLAALKTFGRFFCLRTTDSPELRKHQDEGTFFFIEGHSSVSSSCRGVFVFVLPL